MTSQEIKNSLSNPGTSFWLSAAIESADRRDCVDMAKDVDILKLYCDAKLDELNTVLHCISTCKS
jgi:hypothetical protein